MGRMRRLGWRAPAITLAAMCAVIGAAAGVGAQPLTAEHPADPSTYDPYFAEQWALPAMHVPAAWLRSTGVGVRVGVVDTGVDLAHEDLAGKVVASTSCLGAADVAAACHGSGQDDEGHGTHVAGIVAADTFNGKGVASVAPGALLVVAKSLDGTGGGTVADVNAGIEWAVDHGARIVNLSLEADGTDVTVTPGQSMADGVEYAWRHGAIPVVASGNATPSLFGPTGYSGIDAVVVGATGRAGEPAWYSGPLTGAKWGVMAPGGDARGPEGTASCAGPLAAGCIVSTGWFAGRSNAYADDEGTSMAAPEVSGVLALLLAEGLTPQAAIDRLLATADPLPCGSGCAGAADAAAAVAVAVAPLSYSAAQLRPVPTTTAVPAVRPPGGTGSMPAAAPPPPPPPPGAATPSTVAIAAPSAPPVRPTPAPLLHLEAGRVVPRLRAGHDATAVIAAVILLLAVSVLLTVEATAAVVRRWG